MAYDETIVDRLRELLSDEAGLTEQKMFGGFAFLIDGRLAVAASGQGGVLVRVNAADSDALVTSTNATLMEKRGQGMPGWLLVSPEDVRTKRQLATWANRGVRFARSLPPKH